MKFGKTLKNLINNIPAFTIMKSLSITLFIFLLIPVQAFLQNKDTVSYETQKQVSIKSDTTVVDSIITFKDAIISNEDTIAQSVISTNVDENKKSN